LRALRTLVIDDPETSHANLSRQLARFGVKADFTPDTFAAVAAMERALCQGTPYDVVFLDQMIPDRSGDRLALASAKVFRLAIVDLRLPDIGGVDLISEIRALPVPHGDVPILIATGESRKVIIQAIRAGANGMIEKPYSLAVLKTRVTELMRD